MLLVARWTRDKCKVFNASLLIDRTGSASTQRRATSVWWCIESMSSISSFRDLFRGKYLSRGIGADQWYPKYLALALFGFTRVKSAALFTRTRFYDLGYGIQPLRLGWPGKIFHYTYSKLMLLYLALAVGKLKCLTLMLTKFFTWNMFEFLASLKIICPSS